MGYLQEVDRWLDVIFADLADGKISFPEMKRDIRGRILESYKNGLKAGGQPPAPASGLKSASERRVEGATNAGGPNHMRTYSDDRIATCPIHGLRFNREEARCPDCTLATEELRLAPAVRGGWAGLLKYTCPFCGGKAIREESCSRYACGVQSGLDALKQWNRCENCGHHTKYEGFCTRYPCRQVAGTQSMYNRPKW